MLADLEDEDENEDEDEDEDEDEVPIGPCVAWHSSCSRWPLCSERARSLGVFAGGPPLPP